MEDTDRQSASEAPARTAPKVRERTDPPETKELLARTEVRPQRRKPLRGRRGRLPAAAWVCFTVALLNGIAWGLITPLFQTPDEAGHVAYVQYVAEAGKPPIGGGRIRHFSPQERNLLNALRWKYVQRRRTDRVPGTAAYQKRLQEDGRHSGQSTERRRLHHGHQQPPAVLLRRGGRLPPVAVDRAPRPDPHIAAVLGPACRPYGAVRLPLPEGADTQHTVGLDGRRACGRLPADVRLHLQRRHERHRPVRGVGGDVLSVRACASAAG